jgi:hypothetical protein
MNLLTVDEVTKIWRCRRITVLRLMRSGSLHWIEEEREPLFDEGEVLALKNPKIAVFPHLTMLRRRSRRRLAGIPDQSGEEWLRWHRQKVLESEELIQQTRSLCANSRALLARAQAAAGNLRVEFERWYGPQLPGGVREYGASPK